MDKLEIAAAVVDALQASPTLHASKIVIIDVKTDYDRERDQNMARVEVKFDLR